MGRGTKRNIRTIRVSTNEIKEITDSDKAYIDDTGRKASEIFEDTTESSNEIYDNFIDGTYCPADEGEDKKDKLTREPYKWGHWRNYGGSDVTNPPQELPLIYWKNVIDGNDNEHIPTDSEALAFLKEAKLYPQIMMFPDQELVEANINSTVQTTNNLVDNYQSAMFSGIKLTDTRLATQVGIDYPTAYNGNAPEFEIKVTPYIADLNSYIEYIKQFYDDDVLLEDSYSFIVAISGTIGLAAFIAQMKVALDLIIANPSQIGSILWNYLIGPLTDKLWVFIKPGWNTVLSILEDYVLSIAETVVDSLAALWPIISPILIALAAYAGLILVSDAIWDLTQTQANVTSAGYQFQETVKGIYNFGDIADSTYKLAFGNKYVGIDGEVIKYIVNGGESTGYSLNDYNYGNSFSSSNLIDNFPNNSDFKTKYLNFDFFPKGVQYDLNTPPPVIEYLVELIPTNNCILHPDKVSAFSVRVAPYSYLTPKFSVDTSVTNAECSPLYLNTTATFKNARFADFIYLEDLEKPVGGFTDYYNYTINTDGNESLYRNVFKAYSGNDLTCTGKDIFGKNPLFSPDASPYNVNFMKDHYTNAIYNPYFRVEKDDNAARDRESLKRYWEYPNTEYIDSGAFYKSSGTSSYLKQRVQSLLGVNKGYYILTLEFQKTSGNLYLHTDNYAFENKIYKFGTVNAFANWNDYNSTEAASLGIIYGTNKFEISNSGTHILLLKALDPIIDPTLYFELSSDFDGYIRTCKLQRLHYGAVEQDTPRVTSNMAVPTPKICWQDGFMTEKIVTINLAPQVDTTYSFDITFIPDAVSEVRLNWYNGFVLLATDTYTTPSTLNIAKTFSGGYATIMSISMDLIYDPLDVKEYQISEFVCNDVDIYSLTDNQGAMANAVIDLSNSGVNSNLYDFNFSNVNYFLNTLDVSNTFMDDDVSNIVNISNEFKADNTSISGNLIDVLSIPSLSLINTDINTYGSGQPNYPIGTEPNIVWKNSKTDIPVNELYTLLFALDNSATENGTLDIGGDNPPIRSLTALEAIESLVSKGWTITYNTQGYLVDDGGDYIIDNDGNYIGSGDIEEVTDAPEPEGFFVQLDNMSEVPEWEIYPYAYDDFTTNIMYVDWGDGSPLEQLNDVDPLSHTYSVAGDWIITFTGDLANLTGIDFYNNVQIKNINIPAECTKFDYLYSLEDTFESISIAPEVPLDSLYIIDNVDIVELDLSIFTLLDFITINGCSNLSSITLPEGGILRYVDLENNNIDYINTLNFTSPESSSFVFAINLRYNNLSQASIDLILNDLLSFSKKYDTDLRDNNTTTPSASGLIDLQTLQTAGWIVNVDLLDYGFSEVTINGLTWMAENLAYDTGSSAIRPYADNESNIATYGMLYNFNLASALGDGVGIKGWRLPTNAEWDSMVASLGGSSVAGGALKSTGTTTWNSPNTGATNSSGFNGVGGGKMLFGSSTNLKVLGNYWTAEGHYRTLYYNSTNVTSSSSPGSNLFSIRLVKDAPVTFDEITIGTQTWTSMNLNIDDGLGGIYNYNNDPTNSAIYGKLYSYYAAIRIADSIEGWHLPSQTELETLRTFVGGSGVAGGELKETGTSHWNSPNTGAVDTYGFSLRGAGYAFDLNAGTFSNLNVDSYLWSSTIDYQDAAQTVVISYWFNYNNDNMATNADLVNDEGTNNPILFQSIRLIKD